MYRPGVKILEKSWFLMSSYYKDIYSNIPHALLKEIKDIDHPYKWTYVAYGFYKQDDEYKYWYEINHKTDKVPLSTMLSREEMIYSAVRDTTTANNGIVTNTALWMTTIANMEDYSYNLIANRLIELGAYTSKPKKNKSYKIVTIPRHD